ENMEPWQMAIIQLSSQMQVLTSATTNLQTEMKSLASDVERLKTGLTAQPTTPQSQNQPVIPTSVNPGVNHRPKPTCDLPLSEKTINAIINGEYVNLTDLFADNVYSDNVDHPEQNLMFEDGNLKQQKYRKVKTLATFNQWLSAWNVFENILIQHNPDLYTCLSSYRSLIQDSDKKFTWKSVNTYDIKFRSKLAQKKSFDYQTIDTTLYVTTFDATSVRQQLKCHRCHGNHKVANCTFQEKSTLEK
ncbi:unnamed protein product, partial [Owenia fusiformis]